MDELETVQGCSADLMKSRCLIIKK